MTWWQKVKCRLGYHDWYHSEVFDIILHERAVRTCLCCDRIEMFVQETAWTQIQKGKL